MLETRTLSEKLVPYRDCSWLLHYLERCFCIHSAQHLTRSDGMSSRVAPSSLATANRPLAKPSRTRYFKGKAPEAAPVDSDEDDDDDEDEDEQQRRATARAKKAALAAAEAEKKANLVAGGAGRIIRQGDMQAGQLKMELGGIKVGGKAEPVKREAKPEEESSEEEETDEEDEEDARVKPAPGMPKPSGGESASPDTHSIGLS